MKDVKGLGGGEGAGGGGAAVESGCRFVLRINCLSGLFCSRILEIKEFMCMKRMIDDDFRFVTPPFVLFFFKP